MIEELTNEIKSLDESIREYQRELLRLRNERHLKRVQLKFEIAQVKIGNRRCFVDYRGAQREVELISPVKNIVANLMDIPSEKFLVRNVKTKSEFQVYVSDLKSDIYDNGIICAVIC